MGVTPHPSTVRMGTATTCRALGPLKSQARNLRPSPVHAPSSHQTK